MNSCHSEKAPSIILPNLVKHSIDYRESEVWLTRQLSGPWTQWASSRPLIADVSLQKECIMSEPLPSSIVGATSVITTILSTLAAIFSGWCAYLSYKLSVKLREEMKSDERLIVSKVIHPGLAYNDHDKCVIKCNIFNKSKRKAFINTVQAYDRKNSPMGYNLVESYQPIWQSGKPMSVNWYRGYWRAFCQAERWRRDQLL